MDEKVIYQILKKENPSFSESRLRATAKQIVANPEILESVTLGGLLSKAAASRIGEGIKAAGGLLKTAVPRKPDGSVSMKKIAKRGVIGGALLGGSGLIAQGFGGDSGDETADVVQQQAQVNMAIQLATAQAQGVPLDSIMNNPVAQQIFKGIPGFVTGAMANSGSYEIEGQGVYTGKVTKAGGQYVGSQFVPNIPKETVSLSEWKNQFPIADPKALAQWKSTLVSAGVVSASAGLAELKQQWEVWGEFSQNANKSGQKLTPYQLLDIQRGLWGGGGKDYETSYQVNLLKPENVKSIYKSAREQEAGRIVGDEQAAAFAERIKAQQMAKPTKTEYKKIKGKMTPVTTPGFGEAEAAAAAIELAKKDPMYAEFQTANVFGNALEKALGVRG
jgi:hypothetical protein